MTIEATHEDIYPSNKPITISKLADYDREFHSMMPMSVSLPEEITLTSVKELRVGQEVELGVPGSSVVRLVITEFVSEDSSEYTYKAKSKRG